jgi:hypothetical protein
MSKTTFRLGNAKMSTAIFFVALFCMAAILATIVATKSDSEPKPGVERPRRLLSQNGGAGRP